MKLFCPECRATFEEELEACPHDGSKLFQLDVGEDPLIGMVIDERFRMDWKLGTGGMGAVYRATQLSVNREVAVKVLRPELSDRETSLERFFREAKLVSELTHPNIVRLIDFGQDRKSDLLYLVMELVRGTDLGGLLRSGRFRVAMALEIVFQVCGALTEPHARGVIHRDLKPDNLLVVPVSDGTLQVKVLDFGIARVLEKSTQLTATGMICGTPAYMAPEQAQNHKLDARTDLYALGIMLYEMLSGTAPFDGTSSLQIMLKHIQEEPKRLGEVLPPGAIPEDIEELVYTMMAKEADHRPESALAVRESIDAIRQKHSISPVRLTTMDPKAMFDDWLLPSMPKGSRIRSGPTEALRRETGLSLEVTQSDEDFALAETAMESPSTSSEEEIATLPFTPQHKRKLEEPEAKKGLTGKGGAQVWTPEEQKGVVRLKTKAGRTLDESTAVGSEEASDVPKADQTMSGNWTQKEKKKKTGLMAVGLVLLSVLLIGGTVLFMNIRQDRLASAEAGEIEMIEPVVETVGEDESAVVAVADEDIEEDVGEDEALVLTGHEAEDEAESIDVEEEVPVEAAPVKAVKPREKTRRPPDRQAQRIEEPREPPPRKVEKKTSETTSAEKDEKDEPAKKTTGFPTGLRQAH
ncbi:MAG: protein kinase domain-containing protein [Bradymonadaceae bacterium]